MVSSVLQLAFMHFRYEEEAGEPVLYLYEIQIEEQAQVGMVDACLPTQLNYWQGCCSD